MTASLSINHGTGNILAEQDIEMMKKRSNLSEEEIRKTHAEFWNEFPEGRMTKEGFIQYYPLFSKDAEERGENAGNAFDVFDENHDGVIAFPEFLFMLACDSNSDLAKKYGDVFEMRDTSGNGQWDKNYLIGFLNDWITRSGQARDPDDKDPAAIASEMLGLFGAEENETVNKEQFIIGCIKHPIVAAVFADDPAESS